jgi:hypothetical protein
MELTHELALGRAALTLTRLLDHQMDTIFQDLLQEETLVPSSLPHQQAVSANRIVLLCRNLADELRRYEHLRWLLDHSEDDVNEHEDDADLPF